MLIVDFLRDTRHGQGQHCGGERAERSHDMYVDAHKFRRSIPSNLRHIAFDLLDQLKARIKIYARSYDLEFSNFKEVYTLGGQIRKPILLHFSTCPCLANIRDTDMEEQELNVFKEFYSALFNLSETWDGVTEHVERQNIRHGGVLWQFELMHGKLVSPLLLYLTSKTNNHKSPEVKLYIPFWNFVPNDAEATRRLKRFFDSQSWDIADSYSETVGQLL